MRVLLHCALGIALEHVLLIECKDQDDGNDGNGHAGHDGIIKAAAGQISPHIFHLDQSDGNQARAVALGNDSIRR